jgi:AraC-like DNA-binding protein
MGKLSLSHDTSGRIRSLVAELRHRAPEWAERLLRADSEQEFLGVVSELFNLSHALTPACEDPSLDKTMPARINTFMLANLHRGLTLKVLSEHLGYSEKYCSQLFQAAMGEAFSDYLKRCRVVRATILLRHSDKDIGEIAASLGFSDQFAFSHFFKRATGRSPIQFRLLDRRRSHKSFRTTPDAEL